MQSLLARVMVMALLLCFVAPSIHASTPRDVQGLIHVETNGVAGAGSTAGATNLALTATAWGVGDLISVYGTPAPWSVLNDNILTDYFISQALALDTITLKATAGFTLAAPSTIEGFAIDHSGGASVGHFVGYTYTVHTTSDPSPATATDDQWTTQGVFKRVVWDTTPAFDPRFVFKFNTPASNCTGFRMVLTRNVEGAEALWFGREASYINEIQFFDAVLPVELSSFDIE